MDNQLEVALLGSPEVRLAGTPLTGFRSAKAQALLYYLVATGRAQSRLVVAGLLWGGVDDYYARRNLNRTLSNLSDLVGEHLSITRQTLTFDRSRPYWLDVEALEAAASATSAVGRMDAMTQAVELYRGDFLEGFYIHDAPEFEQWVLAERTRLREIMLQLLQNLADHHAAHDDLFRAIDYVRRALKLEPWREEAHRQLILLLAQSGQRSAALAQYELCRQALAAELNVEPDAATLDLVARIRAGYVDKVTRGQGDKEVGGKAQPSASAVVSPQQNLWTNGARSEEREAAQPDAGTSDLQSKIESPPHNLPLQATPFVGREAELAEIARLLLDEPECRLLTVVGAGGMGKTRLALMAMEQMVESNAGQRKFADGLFFVALEAAGNADGIISTIISVIAEVRGFPLHAAVALKEQLLDFLRNKAMLLLLDNFEHLLKDAELLSTILTAAPAVKLLVTLREAIGLREAWFFSLLGLSVPQTVPDKRAADYDAIRLFVQCARRTQPAFSLNDQRAAVVRICQMVEGMPLGIELAAAWLKSLTPQQLMSELERGLDILTTRFQNIPARHRSMRAVMDYSWNFLAAEERELAARLSVFLGSFRPEAASEVASASLLTLAVLVEKALLRVTPDGRYQLHELTRQYAAEQVTSTAASALRDAHATYYAAFLHQQRPHLYTATYKQVLALVATELDNIRHAWQWIIDAISQRQSGLPVTTLLQQMAEVLAYYHQFQSLWLTGQALFSHAVQVLETAGWGVCDDTRPAPCDQQATLVQIRLYTGFFHLEMGQYGVSLAVAEQALIVCRALNLESELALALLLYGRTQQRRGSNAAATAALQEALALCRHLGSNSGCAEALFTLGMTASAQGYYAQAQSYYQQTLALCQEIGYRPWIARALNNLGTSYSRQQDYKRAQPYYEQALPIAQEVNNQRQIMIVTSNLGGVERGFGHHQLAERYFKQGLALARSLHEQRWVAANLTGLAVTYLEMHDLTAAEQALREAVTVAHRSESTPDTLGGIGFLGHVLARRGQVEAALKALIFAEQHPSGMAQYRLYNEPLLAELRSELPATLFDEAAAWAAGQSLDEVVRWLARSEVTVSQQFHFSEKS